MFRLEDKHLNKAKEFAVHNRKKSKCNHCYDRCYIGTTEENLLVICPKCVDLEKTLEEWKNYIAEIPELKEHFHELFEENPEN
ncbi:MAG: hypothetical protein H8E57_06780 [Candidatus Cloacimonetes bacterium]|nr:hypothetical protein [Candidatus Cloacimonadota bacterium]